MVRFAPIFYTAIAGLGALLVGYDNGIISGVLILPAFMDYFGVLSAPITGAIVSLYTAGAAIGAVMAPYMADRVGRRWCIMTGGAIAAVGCAIQAGSVNTGMLIAGRLIAGLATGIEGVVLPVYNSEIAPPSIRGFLSGWVQFSFSCGSMLASALSYSMQLYYSGNFQFRFPLAFQVVPCLLLVFGCWFIPESPRYLVEKGRQQEAKEVITKLHFTGQNQEWCDTELKEITDQINAEKEVSERSWKAILANKYHRKRLALGCFLISATQWSGINVVFYYGPTIYKSLGYDAHQSLSIQLILNCLSVAWVLGWALSTDHIGRKKPIIISAVLMAVHLLILAVVQTFIPPTSNNHNALRSQIAMLFLLVFWFNPMGTVLWTYLGEIFPMTIRARGNSLCGIVNWVLQLVWGQVSPIGLKNLGQNYYYVFVGLNIFSAVVFIFFYPETKGKTLEQMDELFGDQIVAHALEDRDKAETRVTHIEDGVNVG